jgi:hypothetical protein
MANTINIPKSHLILGLSLPLAVLIGFFLAEPLELGSIAVVLAVLGVLCIPLWMRWYYPALVLCWNAAINPIILPGRIGLWQVLAFLGLTAAIVTRAINPQARFISLPSLTRSLLLLAAVATVTGMLTGGFGIRTLGSDHYGGKRYFALMAAIVGYFALTSRRIPLAHGGLYIACFFLSGITYAIANVAVAAGPAFHFLLSIFSTDLAAQQMTVQDGINNNMVRISGMIAAGPAIYSYLLARYGIRGVLDLRRPWRLLVFLAAVSIGLLGGFRSYVALFALTFLVLFVVEGLHRTSYLPIFVGVILLGSVIILPQANKLPLTAQRALSFLPGRFDPVATQSARATLDWRFEMWEEVLPEVPRYFFHGKGFGFDAGDLYLAAESQRRFQSEALTGTILAGDYHNGPLSILIPLGIYGLLAFLWFLVAGLRVLHRNCRLGSPDYRNVNSFILAAFAARAFFFFTGFGALATDMAFFAGLLGLSVALNGPEEALVRPGEESSIAAELSTQYIKA